MTYDEYRKNPTAFGYGIISPRLLQAMAKNCESRSGRSSETNPRQVRHGDESIPGPYDNRLAQVHPAAFTHGRRRQQAQALAGARIDIEDRNAPTGLDAIKMETRNDPVIGEAEGEM